MVCLHEHSGATSTPTNTAVGSLRAHIRVCVLALRTCGRRAGACGRLRCSGSLLRLDSRCCVPPPVLPAACCRAQPPASRRPLPSAEGGEAGGGGGGGGQARRRPAAPRRAQQRATSQPGQGRRPGGRQAQRQGQHRELSFQGPAAGVGLSMQLSVASINCRDRPRVPIRQMSRMGGPRRHR